jgi:hypothetical protein
MNVDVNPNVAYMYAFLCGVALASGTQGKPYYYYLPMSVTVGFTPTCEFSVQ